MAFLPSFCAVYAPMTPAEVPPYKHTSASNTVWAIAGDHSWRIINAIVPNIFFVQIINSVSK
jgi:hypothetical protein